MVTSLDVIALRTTCVLTGVRGVVQLVATSETTAFALLARPGGGGAVAVLTVDGVRVVEVPPEPSAALGVQADRPVLVVVEGRACVVWPDRLVVVPSSPGGALVSCAVEGPSSWSVVGSRLGEVSGPASGGRAPVLWQHGPVWGATRHVAVLSVDLGAGRACWAERLSLDNADFPPTLIGGDHPVIKAAALRGAGLIVAAAGPGDSEPSRWGMAYLDIAEVNGQGRVTRTVRSFGPFKDSLDGGSGRRHAWHPRFSSSGRYCLLEPFYRTGEWRGRPGTVDLESGELRLVDVPRGFAGAHLVDQVGGDAFWFVDEQRGHRVMVARPR